jgi:hypothetical protein
MENPPGACSDVEGAAAAGSGSAGAAGAAAATSGPTKKAPTPVRKATAPAKKAPAKKAPAKGGGGDDSYEDTPGDRRFILGAVALAAVIAIVLAIFVLRGGDDGELADNQTTTTVTAEETTTTAKPAASTTADPVATTHAPTTTAKATTTTAAPTTTTAKATTTTAAPAAPVVKNGIEPKSCVQNADKSITYTATIKNDSTAPFDYTVRVIFRNADSVVASSEANVTRLAAGASVDFTATGKTTRDLTASGSCTVEKVDARPSGS